MSKKTRSKQGRQASKPLETARRSSQRERTNGFVTGTPVPSATASGTTDLLNDRRKRGLMAAVLLAMLTATVYLPIGWHPFINYDDGTYITNNPNIHDGLNWQTIRWCWTSTYASNWHPVTWMAHALDWQLFGAQAGGHHVVSLLFHVLNVLLLFGLLERVTGAPVKSLVVAGLFAVHPMNVESVAWAAELKNVLCTTFFLLALGAYGWYAQKADVKRYLLGAVLFVLGLASKPMVITLPFVLLLVDYWPLGRVQGWSKPSAVFSVKQATFGNLLFEKLPLVAISLGDAWLTFVAQQSGGSVVAMGGQGVAPSRIDPTLVRIGLESRAANAISSYGMYVYRAFWPSKLALLYPFPVNISLGSMGVVVAAIFLVGMSVLVWNAGRAHRYLVTGWLWYLATLVPVIGLVQVGAQARADRYGYIPLMGIFVMAVWGAAEVWGAKQTGRTALVATAAVVIAILAIVCARQRGYWRSSLDVWTHALAVTDNNLVAEHNLSVELLQLGRNEEAKPHLLKALSIYPYDDANRANLGVVLQGEGRYQEALQQYAMVLQHSSDRQILPGIYENVGNIYRATGDEAKAEMSFREALRLQPARAEVMNELGAVLIDKIIKQQADAMEKNPTADGYVRLGRMLRDEHRDAEAKSAFEKAVKLGGKIPEGQ